MVCDGLFHRGGSKVVSMTWLVAKHLKVSEVLVDAFLSLFGNPEVVHDVIRELDALESTLLRPGHHKRLSLDADELGLACQAIF